MTDASKNESLRWLDDARNVRKVYRFVWVVCAVLLVAGEGLLVWSRAVGDDHVGHPGFAFETWPGFYALFGFVACVALVLAAKELRKLLMRPADYYEPETDGPANEDRVRDGD